MTIKYALERKPIITSLVSEEDLDCMLKSTSTITFLLSGNIFSLEKLVNEIKDAGKLIFVHVDLIEGIGKDKMGIRYLADKVGIDGVVSTRSNIILAAKRAGLLTVQRLFVMDSVSVDNSIKVLKSSQPDAIEVLPGMVVPRVIKKIQDELDLPIIAGGLITDLADMKSALESGAIGISTSSKELWNWQDSSKK